MKQNNYVVIMAGGIGSRFWPLSRVSKPKQFLDILGTGKSLIRLTFERFNRIIPKENIFIVANEQYRSLVNEQLPELDDSQFLGEPMAKNTAPCIAYATHKIKHINPNANIVVAPSDHLILDEKAFLNQIEKAFNYTTQHQALITLGIKPHRPDTGYGYIQFLEESVEDNVFPVKTFTEKPNLELALQFIESGDFLWNAGIFIWNVNAISNALQKHLPEMDDLFTEGEKIYGTGGEAAFIERIYPACENISIDYGVIEKADNVLVIPSDFGWSDLGTWKSLNDVLQNGADENGNICLNTSALFENTENCFVASDQEKIIVLQGVSDIYVVNTRDALLICNKEQEQEVKNIVGELRKKFNGSYN